MSFWKRPAKTQGAEREKALARSSDDWGREIGRLKNEQDALAVELSALTASAGRAMLDQHDALAADLQARITAATTRQSVLSSAIAAAEDRRQDAERDEARRRLTVLYRRHVAMLATWVAATAAVKQAEQNLSAAIQSRAAVVDREQMETLARELLSHGITPITSANVTDVSDPAAFRAEAERLRRLAETASIDDHGQVIESAEQIDADAIPLTAKEQAVAELERQQPAMERRRKLAELDQQLTDARQRRQRLQHDNAAHPDDRQRSAARVAELEAERDVLVGAGEKVEAPA